MRELAKRSSVSYSTIQKWFQKPNPSSPQVNHASKVCIALGVTLNDVFYEGAKPKPETHELLRTMGQAMILVATSLESQNNIGNRNDAAAVARAVDDAQVRPQGQIGSQKKKKARKR